MAQGMERFPLAYVPNVSVPDVPVSYASKGASDQDYTLVSFEPDQAPSQVVAPVPHSFSDDAIGVGKAAYQGVFGTGRSIGAATNTYLNDLSDVELYAEAQKVAASKNPAAQQEFMAEVARRKKANPDGSVLSKIGDVFGAAAGNKMGTAQFVAEQASNSAVALGAGWAGGKAGAMAGAAAAPFLGPLAPVAPVVGGVGGFLAGMFLGNTLLETGGKAMEKAGDGFTQAERGEAMREGMVKGGVITAVDAATLGTGGLIAKSLNRAAIQAGARAEAGVLASAGVDVGSRSAVESALASNKALRDATALAGQKAASEAATFGRRAAIGGTGLTMETVGEGGGEYLGELAATGKADVHDAALEALAGFSQSGLETAWNMRNASGNNLNAKGIVKAGPPDSATQSDDIGTGPTGGAPGAIEGEFLGRDQIADQRGGPIATRQPETYTQITPTVLPRLALPAPEAGGPSDRQVSTAIGLLKHSPKASPELLQRLMRVDQTMATMLFNHWQGQTNGQVTGNQATEIPAAGDQGQGTDIAGSRVMDGFSDGAVSFIPGAAAEDAALGGEPGMALGGAGPDAVTPLDVQAHAAATSPFNATPQPTEAQKAAGNYKVGRIKFQGMDISIENPAGSVRSGTDEDGKAWETQIQHHYGYIKGTVGKDKDHLDVFIKPGAQSARTAYVIDQINPKTGAFDEHKIVFGADSEADAQAIYHANYEQGWQGMGAITAMPIEQFKDWIKSGKTKKPVAYTEPKEIRTASRAPKTASSLLQAIVNRGGISREIMSDVGVDPAGRYMPGLFTKTGTTDLSALAGYLFDEDGFHQIRQDSAIGPARELEDLIVRALGGEKVLSTTAMEKGAQAEETAKLKEKAQRLGVKTVARKLEDIAADVLRIEAQNVLDEETALEDEALVAYNETVDALHAAIGEDDAENFLEALASKYQDETHLNYLRSATADIQEKINEQALSAAAKPDEATGRAAEEGDGTGVAPGGDRASGEEARPSISLSGQSEAEIRAEQERVAAAEAQRKAEDERAAAAERQARIDAEVAGRQDVAADNFTLTPQVNNKTQQKKADQAEIDRQLAGQGDFSLFFDQEETEDQKRQRAIDDAKRAAGKVLIARARESRDDRFIVGNQSLSVMVEAIERMDRGEIDSRDASKAIEESLNLRDDVRIDAGDTGDVRVRSVAGNILAETYTGRHVDIGSPAWKDGNMSKAVVQGLRENPAAFVRNLREAQGQAIADTEAETEAMFKYLRETIPHENYRMTPEGRRDEFRVISANSEKQPADPVAESLAPAPSEPGDDGVATIQGGAAAAAIAGKPVSEMSDDQLRTIARGLSPTFGEAAVDKAAAELARRDEAGSPKESKEPWQYGELEYGDKYIDETVLPDLRKQLANAHGGKFQEYPSKAAAVRGLKERIDTLENHRDAKARKYYASLDNHYGAVRAALADGKPVPPVAYESYEDLKGDVSAGRIKGDGQEVARVEQPQHIEVGQVEPATAPVIAASLKESAKNTPMNIEQAREWLLSEIDKAIIDAKSAKEEGIWNRADDKVNLEGVMDVGATIGFKTFNVPGDGKFRVLNLKESLQKFKKQVAASPGFKKNATRPMSLASGNGGKTSVRDMLDDGEYVLAADYGHLTGKPLLFGAVRKSEAHPIAYTDAEPVDIKGIEAQVGREWNATGKSFSWRVIETTTGMSVSSESTKEQAISKALAHVDEHGTGKLIAQIKEAPKVSQAELERQFTDWGSEEEAKAQKTRDAVERADAEDRALWNSIWPLDDGKKRSPNPWNDINHMQVVILAKDAAKAGKGDEFVSLIERRLGGTNNVLALAARKALAESNKPSKQSGGVDYKGFERTPTGNGNFTLKDGNLLVKVEAMGGGKFQASHGSAKSSPHINSEQGAVDWAANLRDASKKTTAYPFYSNNKLFNAEGTAELPKDWTGVARSDSGKRFFYLGQENGERSFNPLKAESYEDALKEAEGLKNDKPVVPDGYREVARGYFGGTIEKPIYAPFAEGERVRFIGGHAGNIQSFIGGPVTTGAIIKYDNGLTGRAEWRDVEAIKKPAAEQEPKNFKSIDTLNAANNPLGEDDWIRFADGSEWQVKGRMNGWALVQGKTEHPTVKNIMGQVPFIRAVVDANDAAQATKGAEDPSLPVNTGVNARMVVVEKGEGGGVESRAIQPSSLTGRLGAFLLEDESLDSVESGPDGSGNLGIRRTTGPHGERLVSIPADLLRSANLNSSFAQGGVEVGGVASDFHGNSVDAGTGLVQGDSPLNVVGDGPANVSRSRRSNAATLESGKNGRPMQSTKGVSDLLIGGSLRAHLKRLVEIPGQRISLVEPNMVPSGKDLKIVGGVIQAIPIDMMDVFVSGKTATGKPFSNIPVFVLPSNSLVESVSLLDDVTGAPWADKVSGFGHDRTSHINTSKIRSIEQVVKRFMDRFPAANQLSIKVVWARQDLPTHAVASDNAEAIFLDSYGQVFLVASNIYGGDARAFQILLHECIGHFGLAQMMGGRFGGILKEVMRAARAKGEVGEDIYEPGHPDYATMEAVKLRYPEASDEEVAQEVLARMAETDPGRTLFGYVRAVVRQWLRDMARAAGITLDVTTAELNDLVAQASRYMRRGDGVAQGVDVDALGVADMAVGGMASRGTVSPAPTFRVVDLFGNGSRVQHFDDKRGLFYEAQKYPSGRTGWRAGEVIDGRDYWLSDKEFGSMEEAQGAVRGLRISNTAKQKKADKYGAIPALWAGEARRVAKAIIDAGIGVERFSASTQSASKYVYLSSGLKVRIADHSLPGAYDQPDVDYRYGGDIKALVEEIRQTEEGAPTPDSGELGSRALSNQDAGAVSLRADESGQLKEPAQSGSGAGSDTMLSEKVGAGKTASGGMESRAAPTAGKPKEPRTGILDTILRKAGGELAAKITGPAYDKLTAYLGGKVPEGIKAGMVSDYGLDESYVDRRTGMQTEQQKAARQTKTFVEGLMDLDRAQSRVAYQWLNNRGAEADRLMAQLPPESQQVLKDIKTQIAKLTIEAVRLGQLDAETASRNFLAYLHRSYAKYDLNTDDKTWKAERAKAIKILGDQYKGRGLKMDVDPDRIHSAPGWWQDEMKGKRVKVLKNDAGRFAFVAEGTAIPPNLSGYKVEGVWEIRARKAADRITLWRDFTQDERQMMGELDEAKYAVARTLFMMNRDIEVGRFHEWVADEYAKTPEEAEEEGLQMADASDSMMRAFTPDEWVTVPTSKIPGTGVFKFGALAGMVVPGPVWNDIRQISAGRFEPFGAAYASILRAWKLSKTALTPTTHVNNIMGNFVMADMHDVGARDAIAAVRLMAAAANGDKDAKAMLDRFEDSGATQGMFTTHELKKEVLEPLLQQLREEVGMADDEAAILKASAIMSLALHGQFGEAWAGAKAAAKQSMAGRVTGAVVTKAQDYYQAEDSVFRLAAFLKSVDEGKTDLEAGKLARKAFLDYHINAPWINAMRGTAMPFIAFAYRAIPMLTETAAKKPWKIAKYMLVAGGLNALAYAMLGADADEDKERAYLPEEKAGRLWGIVPKLIRMPWNRESKLRDGKTTSDPVFLDVRRWIPVGDVVDYGQDKTALPMIPQPLIPGGPLIMAAEFLVNKSAFTGKELTKETDTWVEKAAKVGGHFYKGFMPNVPIPYSGTWAGTKIDSAVKGREDPLGRAYPVPEAIASGFGLKLERYPVDTLQRNAVLDMKGKLRELSDAQRQAARDYGRQGMTKRELDEKVTEIVGKKNATIEEYKVKERKAMGKTAP